MTELPGHQPVLPQQVVELLAPRGKGTLADLTVGLGGHSELLLEEAGPEAQLIALDVDEENLQSARRRLEPFGRRARFFRANFAEIADVLAEAGTPRVDLILADLGISSSQLDQPERGLSFQVDGPLDMRLDDRLDTTAADLVNRLREKDLADLIYQNADERFSRRIARAIVAERKRSRLTRTLELADVVARAIPAPARRSRRGVHPATRTFQALRIAVNDELGALDRLLAQLPDVLSDRGRAGIISFHSLEDRRVKLAFRQMKQEGWGEPITRKPIRPDPDEAHENPRSRSARFRVFERRRHHG